MSMIAARWRVLAAAASLSIAAPVSAHPLATTSVSIVVTDTGMVDLTIEADADALVARLEELVGARLQSLASPLIAHLDVWADDVRLTVQLRDLVVDESAQVRIRLFAAIPASAHALTWQSRFMAGSYPIAVRTADGRETIEWLRGPQVSAPITLAGAHGGVGLANGFVTGFTHIVPAGLDHVLFVLGLFLLSRRTREVLLQVTAFTVAHSITLALGLYGVLSAPASIVEPMIALSVAYVGVENLMTSRLHPWRIGVVFAFGLLHGLGFAEALAGLHLTTSSFVTTLLSFNLGVEAGQLTVIAAAAVALAIVSRLRATASVPTIRFASAAIGVVGTIWTIQRLTGG